MIGNGHNCGREIQNRRHPRSNETIGDFLCAGSWRCDDADGNSKFFDKRRKIIKITDFVLIPVTPSPYDLWAASDLVEFIKARQEVTDGKPAARFIISRAIAGTRLGDEIVKRTDQVVVHQRNDRIVGDNGNDILIGGAGTDAE